MSNFHQHTINQAAFLYSQGIKGGWNKVAELLTAQGHIPIHGTYIHGQAICTAVLAVPEYAHLRKNRQFGADKRLLIAQAILNAGFNPQDVTRILKLIP